MESTIVKSLRPEFEPVTVVWSNTIPDDALKLKKIMKIILLFRAKLRFHTFGVFSSAFLILLSMVGCGPSKADLEAVSYTPIRRDGCKVSTPTEQELNPMLVAELDYNAAKLETIHSLLVIKNGYLVAEDYFNYVVMDSEDHAATKFFVRTKNC